MASSPQVWEIKRVRANRVVALAVQEQEVRVTAVEAFDLRVLINEDYGRRACVSPNFGTITRRQQPSRKTRDRTSSSFLKRCSWTIPIYISLINTQMCKMDFMLR